MGCLQVYVESRTRRDISVGAEGMNEAPAVTVLPVQSDLGVETENLNVLVVIGAENKNTAPAVTAESANARMSISIGLVCQVGLGVFRVFYVEEGPFMVEEGYFMVAKS